MSENSFQNSGNFFYELTLKNERIEDLVNENSQYSQIIQNLKSEIFSLRTKLSTFRNLSHQLKTLQEKNFELEKKIEILSKEILMLTKESKEEKRKIQNKFYTEIKRLKKEQEGYKSKIEMANYLENEKDGLLIAFNKMAKDKKQIIQEQNKILQENKINSEIKMFNFKKKMTETMNSAQGKMDELNKKYSDINTKLALFQNQQIIAKFHHQSILFSELTETNKNLEKQIFELKKELELHKQVELTLAEKYKKINEEKNSINNPNSTSYSGNSRKIRKNSRDEENKNVLSMRKKILNLENALLIKQMNLDEERYKNNTIQKQFKEKEKKYFGIFNYLEDCLKLFFNDDYLKSKKDLYIHINEIKKGDFSQLTKNEKYATLVILMKYLFPLIYHDDKMSDRYFNLKHKFHLLNKENNFINLLGNNSVRNNENLDKKIFNKKILKKLEGNLELPFNFSFNSCDNSHKSIDRLSFTTAKKSINNIK